jgi:flagellar basal-body rod protein FlgG
VNNAFYIGAAALRTYQTANEGTANNVANINTDQYKRVNVSFAEMVGASPGADGDRAAEAAASNLGVSVLAQDRVFTGGDLRKTDNPLDVAVVGDGLFEVVGPGGQTLLWRGGTLRVNADGFLSAGNGMALRPAIHVPQEARRLEIDADGRVRARLDGQALPLELGQLELVMPSDTRALRSSANGLFRAADDADLVRAHPGEQGLGLLQQNAVETSNVKLSDELVNLMLQQRAFAANARVVQYGDELMGLVTGLKR